MLPLHQRTEGKVEEYQRREEESIKARRGKQALTKSTKQKRPGRKHGGSIRKHKHKPKVKHAAEEPNGVLNTEDEYQKKTEKVIEIIEVKNLETPSEVAAVIKDNFLKGKPRKEKAAILNGFALHAGKYRASLATILLVATLYAFHHFGLSGTISRKTQEIWNSLPAVNLFSSADQNASELNNGVDPLSLDEEKTKSITEQNYDKNEAAANADESDQPPVTMLKVIETDNPLVFAHNPAADQTSYPSAPATGAASPNLKKEVFGSGEERNNNKLNESIHSNTQAAESILGNTFNGDETIAKNADDVISEDYTKDLDKKVRYEAAAAAAKLFAEVATLTANKEYEKLAALVGSNPTAAEFLLRPLQDGSNPELPNFVNSQPNFKKLKTFNDTIAAVNEMKKKYEDAYTNLLRYSKPLTEKAIVSAEKQAIAVVKTVTQVVDKPMSIYNSFIGEDYFPYYSIAIIIFYPEAADAAVVYESISEYLANYLKEQMENFPQLPTAVTEARARLSESIVKRFASDPSNKEALNNVASADLPAEKFAEKFAEYFEKERKNYPRDSTKASKRERASLVRELAAKIVSEKEFASNYFFSENFDENLKNQLKKVVITHDEAAEALIAQQVTDEKLAAGLTEACKRSKNIRYAISDAKSRLVNYVKASSDSEKSDEEKKKIVESILNQIYSQSLEIN